MTAQIVSLFSGVGGLEMGIQSALGGGDVIAHVEFDAEPSKVLAHHWPDVPNLGDITKVDWTTFVLEHPELGHLTGNYRAGVIMCGGFPCQDVSLAGRRAGMKTGTRSGLWTEFARAIDELRPELVVIENVRGLLSAEADRNMESSPWGVGDRHDGPALRALGAVLGDLADLGYDAEWCGLRASDAGAPHARYRIFVIAYPHGRRSRGRAAAPGHGEGQEPDPQADGAGPRADRGLASDAGSAPRAVGCGPEQGTAEREGRRPDDEGSPIPPADADDSSGDGRERATGRGEIRRVTPPRDSRGRFVRSATADAGHGPEQRERARPELRGRSKTPADADRRRHGQQQDAGRVGRVDVEDARLTPERQRTRSIAGDRGPEVPDADGRGLEGVRGVDTSRRDADRRDRETETAWGDYEPAIRRWEAVLGRPAPDPTQLSETFLARRRRRLARLDPRPVGMRGSLKPARQLAPRFVEWMMGYPAGHVVDAGISRNAELTALGNSVCPQQAALAVRYLLGES